MKLTDTLFSFLFDFSTLLPQNTWKELVEVVLTRLSPEDRQEVQDLIKEEQQITESKLIRLKHLQKLIKRYRHGTEN
jgi:hypothetical protein